MRRLINDYFSNIFFSYLELFVSYLWIYRRSVFLIIYGNVHLMLYLQLYCNRFDPPYLSYVKTVHSSIIDSNYFYKLCIFLGIVDDALFFGFIN